MTEIINIGAAALCAIGISAAGYKKKYLKISVLKRIVLLILVESCCAAGCIVKDLNIADSLFMIFFVSALYLLSVEDIETRTVPSMMLNVVIMAGAVCSVINITDGGAGRIIIFCLIFAILFAAARREKLGIGTGDAKIIAAAALFMDPGKLFVALFMSLFISMIYGIYIIIRKRSGVKTELPFIPFLLAGTLISLIG